MPQAHPIYEQVARFIADGEAAGDARFNTLAREVFAYQYDHNAIYRRFCDGRGRTPATVRAWAEIPAVPAAAFKEFELACGDAPPELEFLSSGTSRGAAHRSRHRIPYAALYHQALECQFRACVLPDAAPLEMVLLAPSPALAPQSSLVHMLEYLRQNCATGGRYYIKDDGPEFEAVAARLEAAAATAQAVLLAGITPAFLQLVLWLQAQDRRFVLGPGSRIMDTGGAKNFPAQFDRAQIEALYTAGFGVPASHIVNEYGMTEICSQFYDPRLRARAGHAAGDGLAAPHWVRTRVLDPDSLDEVAPGELGLLQHLDLANCGSVAAILTDDLGRRTATGFTLAGRVRGAEPRGCALLLQDLLHAGPARPTA